MTSHKIARDYLAKVEARLEALRLFLARQRHDDVVREAHEAIQLLLKGALRFVGVDLPRRHDPAPVVMTHLDRFPAAWRAYASEMLAASERLFGERARHAMYIHRVVRTQLYLWTLNRRHYPMPDLTFHTG